ncbi:MAG: peptide-binding protein [Patescibacteria group bacterium]
MNSIFKKNSLEFSLFEKILVVIFFISGIFGIFISSLYKDGYRIVITDSNETSISANFLGFVNRRENYYIEGVVGEIDKINPLFSKSSVSSFNSVDQDVSSLIFSGLLKRNEGKFLPDLAIENPKISDDGRVYEFNLRQNVFWHDGKKFSADDILYTFSTIQSLDIASGDLQAIWSGVLIEKTSDYSVKFTLPRKSMDFLENFTQGIVPKHLLEKISAREIFNSSFNYNPVGTGPFVFLERKSTDELVLKRNSSFYGRVPEISELHFKFFKSSLELENSFKKGEIDGFFSTKDLNFKNKTEIKSSTKTFVFLNSRNLNQKLRDAIMFGISAEFVQSGNLNFYPKYEESIEKSRLSFFEFGLKEDNGWKWSDGREFSLRILALDTEESRMSATKISEKLMKNVFVKSEISYFAGSEFWNNKVFNRDYDILIVPIKVSKISPYVFFHSNYSFGINGFNFSGYSNKKIDIAIEEYELSNGEKSSDIFSKIQDLKLFGILDKKKNFYYSKFQVNLPKEIFDPSERFFFANSWYVWKKVEVKKGN